MNTYTIAEIQHNLTMLRHELAEEISAVANGCWYDGTSITREAINIWQSRLEDAIRNHPKVIQSAFRPDDHRNMRNPDRACNEY